MKKKTGMIDRVSEILKGCKKVRMTKKMKENHLKVMEELDKMNKDVSAKQMGFKLKEYK